MRNFAIALTIAAFVTGGAQAADIGKSVKSSTNSIASSIGGLANPTGTPNVADLVNANRIDGTQDDKLANSDDGFYISTESEGRGSYSLQVQKKLLEF